MPEANSGVPALSASNYEEDDYLSYEDAASAAPHDDNGAPVYSGGGATGGSSGGSGVAGPVESQQITTDITALEKQHAELTEHYNTEVKNWETTTQAEAANYQKALGEWQKEPRSYVDGEGHTVPLDPGPAPSPPIPVPKPQPPAELTHIATEITGLKPAPAPPKPKGILPNVIRRK